MSIACILAEARRGGETGWDWGFRKARVCIPHPGFLLRIKSSPLKEQ